MITHVNFSDSSGGAAVAARRLHEALVQSGITSRMAVAQKQSAQASMKAPVQFFGRRWSSLRAVAGTQIGRRLMSVQTPSPLSYAFFPSRWPRRLNGSDADLVHLHWLGAEMMSVEDIARIEKPLVWTLHDMWAFCGAEHCAYDERWCDGYSRANRPAGERGLDLNRWVWERKRRAWTKPFQIVSPSRWLASCVEESALMRGWPVAVIPNALETENFVPMDKGAARKRLGLPMGASLVAFGVAGPVVPYHKGFDLLRGALDRLRARLPGVEALLIGLQAPEGGAGLGLPAHYTGHLEEEALIAAYAAADCLIIPSRIDNLPNMGLEALACGRPVVAFDVCGLPDIVTHQRTGWLARPFDVADLAEGIAWVLEDETRLAALGRAAREEACTRFAAPVVAAQYTALYEQVLRKGV